MNNYAHPESRSIHIYTNFNIHHRSKTANTHNTFLHNNIFIHVFQDVILNYRAHR